jgi:hypothetical protein
MQVLTHERCGAEAASQSTIGNDALLFVICAFLVGVVTDEMLAASPD